ARGGDAGAKGGRLMRGGGWVGGRPVPRRPLLLGTAAFLSLRPMPFLFPACAVPCLADVSPLRLRLNGAWFGLLHGGALPQLAVGLPLGAFPVPDVPPQLLVGLRPLGVPAATTMVAAMLRRCSRRTFRPVGQPRLKMDRVAANFATARIGGYR